MPSKVPKHEHDMRIVAHRLDRSGVITMCGTTRCTHTEIHLLEAMRIKVAPRKYRKAEMPEFREQFRGLPHLCCRSNP